MNDNERQARLRAIIDPVMDRLFQGIDDLRATLGGNYTEMVMTLRDMGLDDISDGYAEWSEA
jgi:hypothetical protein